MKDDFLKDKTVVYSGSAQLKGTSSEAMICLCVLIILCVLAFNLLTPLPYSGFIKIAVLALTAVGINYVLKKGTFTVTYVLTQDNTLVFVTSYGSLKWETAWIPLDKASFGENFIVYEKRKYSFFPDDELKALLLSYRESSAS